MSGNLIANSVNAVIDNTPIARTEAFQSETGIGPSPARAAIVSIITFAIIFGILLFAGKFLWNNVLVALIPAVKPAKSVWQILGLALLISLMHPGSCSCA